MREISLENYLRAEDDRAIDDLAATTNGRNEALNKASHACGQLVAGAESAGVTVGDISKNTIKDRPFAAAEQNRYVSKDGAKAARDTINSCIEAGLHDPQDFSKVGVTGDHARRRETEKDAEKKWQNAKQISTSSEAFHGSPAARYLSEARGIAVDALPAEAYKDLRFAAHCPFGVGGPGEPVVPALIAQLRNAITGELTGAIQRTFLEADGSGKASKVGGRQLEPREAKKGLGQFGENAAVIFGDLIGEVIVAEGIEDALTGACVAGRPAIATLGRDRLDKVYLPADCSMLLLGQAKNDEDRKAWRAKAQSIANGGVKVRIAWPGACADFNDLLREVGREAVADAIAKAETVEPQVSEPETIERPTPAKACSKDDPLFAKRHAANLAAMLKAEVADISALKAGEARNTALVSFGGKVGPYVLHKYITADEVVFLALEASRANGALKKDGKAACRTAVLNGIKKAHNDDLPTLRDRPAPSTNGDGGAYKNGHDKSNGGSKGKNGDKRNGGGEPQIESEIHVEPAPASAERIEIKPQATKREEKLKIAWPDVTEEGNPRARSQPNMAAFLEWRGVKLSRNAFSMRDYAEINGEKVPVDDELIRQLRLEADALGFKPYEKYFYDVVRDTARRNSFHPPLEYLASNKWDGVRRLNGLLPTYLGADDTELHRAWGAIHLIAAVRRLKSPGIKHDAMLIFEGPQGSGKSSAVGVLGGEWFSDALMLGSAAKEVIENTSGSWLIELAELSGIRGREVEHIKAMISRQTDRARLSYGRETVDRPRQFVLFGTVNNSRYLRDTTGNRRFWPVKVGRIDLAALKRDRDQIWAEAAHREAAGESIQLDPSLYAAASEAQGKCVIEEPWRDILETQLDLLLQGRTVTLGTDDVWRILGIDTKSRDGNNGGKLTEIMEGLGWRKGRVRCPGYTSPRHCYTNQKAGEAPRWEKL